MLIKSSTFVLIFIVGLMIILAGKTTPLVNAKHRSSGIDGFLPVPKNPLTAPNSVAFSHLPNDAIAGSEVPKNLIVASCNTPVIGENGCAPIIGSEKDDIIYATAVTDALIYGLGGDDFILGGAGHSKMYGGNGDDIIVAGAESIMYGGPGNDILIGSGGNDLMVGGPGNDQLFAGTGHDILIGGGGANYFDCGPNGNAVVLDFNVANGDTKASDCKFVVTLNPGVGSTINH